MSRPIGATTSPSGRRRRRVVGMLVALVATVLANIGAPGSPAGAAGFRTVAPPVDLGGPNGTEEHVATSINERGRIAGWSENFDPGGGEPNAWIQWPSRGIARQEIMPNYSASRITDRGEVVVGFFATGGEIYRIGTGVVWHRGVDWPAGSEDVWLRALNDHGEALAQSRPLGAPNDWIALRSPDGRWRWVAQGIPSAINNEGLIAGYEGEAGGGPGARARIWGRLGATQPLPVPGDAQHSMAVALNNRGDVAGVYADAEGRHRPMFWRLAGRPGWITNGVHEHHAISVPDGHSCDVRSISDARVVVGHCDAHQGLGPRAFAWHPSAGYVELPPLHPGDETRALDVNEAGYVVGHSGLRAVMWRVVP